MEITYNIAYHHKVVTDDLPRIGKNDKLRLRRAIEEKLSTKPDIFGKPLRQSLAGYRALRVGDYRIVFRVEKKTVKVLAILHRTHVYDEILRRYT